MANWLFTNEHLIRICRELVPEAEDIVYFHTLASGEQILELNKDGERAKIVFNNRHRALSQNGFMAMAKRQLPKKWFPQPQFIASDVIADELSGG